MKNIFYYFIKYTIQFASKCYFRKVKIIGLENIPKEGGILFSPNHQGAFLDPLLVGSIVIQQVTSLTRSDVFGGKFQWFLDALKMLPVYRIRNGYSNLRRNEEIFDKCRKFLCSKESIIMFSEAAHHNEFFLQSLSKGSSRLVYEAQVESNFPIYLVPVGINYGHHTKPLCDLHLVFGKPIEVRNFLDDSLSKAETINNIREKLKSRMKKCIWLPNNDINYSKRKKLINRINTEMDFEDLKKGIGLMNLKTEKKYKNKLGFKLLLAISYVPNLPPLLIMKKILSLFEDIVFYSSIKLTAGLILFGVWWVILYVLIGIYFDWILALPVIFTCILFLYIRQSLLYIKYE
ncbi:MAG: hypothetical protein CBC28_08360 [Flavobacteriaceae bacterium TMED68]|nr:MAG: hypothetical protein CBC28_08360 [Flavobacteriaceae bacterium TMED68]|tara:strand:- start:620 stop:1660 length:1041 start_codon:yes stop_codon:yes gene_type:complete